MAVFACLTLCMALVSCGGAKNPYEAYAKKGTKDLDIEKTSGESKTNAVTEYYLLKGDFKVNSSGRFHMDMTETTRVPRDNDKNTDAYEINADITMAYDFRDNLLTVYVEKYQYRTEAVTNEKETAYEWKDGYVFQPEKAADSTLPADKFQFDMSKYFENGKLTAEDATVAIDLKDGDLTSNLKGLTTTTYTERNPDWEKAAIADIMDMVNAVLAEVDAIVAK